MAKQTAVLGLATLFLTVAIPASAATTDSTVSLVLPEPTTPAPAATTDSTVSLVLPEPTTPAPAATTDTPEPSTIAGPTRVYNLSPTPTVDVVTLNGSGCPGDTADVDLSADNTSFEINFSRFSAVVAADSPGSRNQVNCVVGLAVDLPEGHTFAVREIPVAVEVDLAAGARAEHLLSYKFSGTATSTDVAATVDGPYQGVWRSRYKVADDSLVWLPCGQKRQLTLNHRLNLLSGTSTAANSAQLSTMASPRLIWARC